MNQNKELFGQGGGSELNIRDFLYKYVRNWKWFFLSVVLALGIGFIYVRAQVPQYLVETDIEIKDQTSSSSDAKDILQQMNLNSSNKIIDNEIQILKSHTLMENVVNALHLQTSYYVKNHVSRIVLYGNLGFDVELLKPNEQSYLQPWPLKIINDSQANFNGKIVSLNQLVSTAAGLILIRPSMPVMSRRLIQVTFNTTESVAASYITNLKIEAATKDATVLLIKLQDSDPQRGKDILKQFS